MANEAELLRQLYEASLDSTVQSLRTIHRLKQQPGCAPAAEVRAAAPPPPAGDVLLELARASLEHYNQILSLSARYTDRVIDRLRDLTRQTGARHGRHALHLRGAVGEEASAEFEIDNPKSEAVEVNLAVSEFHGDAGGPFSTAARFAPVDGDAPADRRVPAGTTRRFRVTVALAAPFAAGHHYRAQVLVVCRGRAVDELALTVDVTGTAEVPAPRVSLGGGS